MKIRGTVEEGEKVGRKLGYSTANIAVEASLPVPDGVYAATADYGGRCYGALANLGIRPTVSDGKQRVLEVHLIGFDGNLYGRELTVRLVQHIREERKFDSTEELRRQIGKDKEEILRILNERQCI